MVVQAQPDHGEKDPTRQRKTTTSQFGLAVGTGTQVIWIVTVSAQRYRPFPSTTCNPPVPGFAPIASPARPPAPLPPPAHPPSARHHPPLTPSPVLPRPVTHSQSAPPSPRLACPLKLKLAQSPPPLDAALVVRPTSPHRSSSIALVPAPITLHLTEPLSLAPTLSRTLTLTRTRTVP